jgi:hypothetical protein
MVDVIDCGLRLDTVVSYDRELDLPNAGSRRRWVRLRSGASSDP